MNFLIFDTETTGIPCHPKSKPEMQPNVIEFGGILVNEQCEVLEELNVLIRPPDSFKGEEKIAKLLTWQGIERITGIKKEDLEEEPLFADVLSQIRPLFEKADVLIAHNMPFDFGVMDLELKRNQVTDWPWPEKKICTVQEHQPQWGYRPKLLQLFEHYTGVPLDQTHRAIDDARALFIVCALGGILR